MDTPQNKHTQNITKNQSLGYRISEYTYLTPITRPSGYVFPTENCIFQDFSCLTTIRLVLFLFFNRVVIIAPVRTHGVPQPSFCDLSCPLSEVFTVLDH